MGGKLARVIALVERRQELALRQVSRAAEDHEIEWFDFDNMHKGSRAASGRKRLKTPPGGEKQTMMAG
jgi:hypothetical protein